MQRKKPLELTLVIAALVGLVPPAHADPLNVYAPSGWPAMHADARNSDASPVAGSASMAYRWHRTVDGSAAWTAAYSSIAPNGTVYVTAYRPYFEYGCHLIEFTVLGDQRCFTWDLGWGASYATPLIDVAGNIYIGDERTMRSYTAAGVERWRRSVVGIPLSAQFTGDGRLLFATHVGNLYVLDRETGEDYRSSPYDEVAEPTQELVPGATFHPNFYAPPRCLEGEAGCAVANMPAIDLATGFVTLTFWPDGSSPSILGLQYVASTPPQITELWEQPLSGGSASSPDISADGTRVYVNSNENTDGQLTCANDGEELGEPDPGEGQLLALHSANGDCIWRQDIGYAPLGSPSTSADGLIIPGAGETGGPIRGIRDLGACPVLEWTIPGWAQAGVPAQAAGGKAYTFAWTEPCAALFPPPTCRLTLLTIDTSTGSITDTDPLPVLPSAPYRSRTTVGTSIGPGGEVVAPSLGGTIYTFQRSP